MASQQGLAVNDFGPDGTLICWGSGDSVENPLDWGASIRELLRGAGSGSPPAGVVGWVGYPQMSSPRPCIIPQTALWAWDTGLWRRPNGHWVVVGQDSQTARRALSEATHHNPAPPIEPELSSASAKLEKHREHYKDAVRSSLRHIQRGDIYQACLSWQHTMDIAVDPYALWRYLRRHNPSERGALLRLDDRFVLSNSPETFMDVGWRDGHLSAQVVPIKGTVRHNDGPKGRIQLESSPKERAELTMIVDLVRNDLGRVAASGTVNAAPRAIRRCGDLVHAEQAVHALLRREFDAIDAIEAAFPPGSVTGAPKIRAMELISELEQNPRGVYTGMTGVWFQDGSAKTSVAIRTLSINATRVQFNSGAGIVAESEPHQEWLETLAKAEALMKAVSACTR